MEEIKTVLLIFGLASLVSCASNPMNKNPYESATPHEQFQFKKVAVPFAEGTNFLISQSAFGNSSHSEPGNEYSWDFDVPYGTAVLSVESGVILQVWQPNVGGGCDSKWSSQAHNIKVQHEDGTVAQYVHVQTDLKSGDKVSKGQVIATTALNGWICRPQLHFGMYLSKDNLYESNLRKTLPLYFVRFGTLREGDKGIVPSKKVTPFTGPEIVKFENGNVELSGELFRPEGKGPFPAVLYNHGSAPGMLNSQASKAIGPLFAAKGWVFFMPYRRGQGLSAKAGKYISDEIEEAYNNGGEKAAGDKLVQLMETDQLSDQMAAAKWLKTQSYVDKNRIAADGNSFGGIQSVLGSTSKNYCAVVSASGGAESWSRSSALQAAMKKAVHESKSPILFFQAENDFDLSPSKILSAEMKAQGKTAEIKIYPPFGKSPKEGHSFAYMGSSVWFDDIFGFIQRHCK